MKNGLPIANSIVVNYCLSGKGHRCSWHYHTNKDETFYIQSGEVLLIYGDVDDMEKAKMKVLGPGDKFYVYPGLRHQMQAREDTELFEFSTHISIPIVIGLNLEIRYE